MGVLPPQIILTTLNAKYIHASLGLRYLLANLARHGGDDLRARAVLREFTLARPTQDVVDSLLSELGTSDQVQIVGFGVYIWNVTATTEVIRRLKQARPQLLIVIGGPEVSYEYETQEIFRLADHLVTGWGDVSFAKLCRSLIHGPRPLMKVHVGEQPALAEIVMPYAEYSSDDLAHRLLYVEASRGCPFKCEFCLSSLDKTAWAFDLDGFLAELDGLYKRGARNFKFVDRTFNLKIEASARILEFFLERLSPGLFLHFEVIPDQLPDRLKDQIARFPEGVLQFEIGIQSFDEQVQKTISRRQDNARTEANVRWLVEHSQAHLHTDLIFGLPGETLAGFAHGFDRLYKLAPHEIQLGVLKRLRGTPIVRHTTAFQMNYGEAPPYTILSNSTIDTDDMQAFVRLARYWDLIANSGRFKTPLPILLSGSSAFAGFQRLSEWLWRSTRSTTGLTPEQLTDAIFDYACTQIGLAPADICISLSADYQVSGARGNPKCLRGGIERNLPKAKLRQLAQRQARHRDSAATDSSHRTTSTN